MEIKRLQSITGLSVALPANAYDSPMFREAIFLTSADSPRTILESEKGKLFVVDCTSGAVTINLPQISTLTLTGGWTVAIKKSDSSGNAITINRASSDTIDDGVTTSKTMTNVNGGWILSASTTPSPDRWTSIPFGEGDLSGYVTIAGAQTISGGKTFSSPVNITHNSSGSISGLTVKTNDGTAANNAGFGVLNEASATPTSRGVFLWIDPNGGDLSGGDYAYLNKVGGAGGLTKLQSMDGDIDFYPSATQVLKLTSTYGEMKKPLRVTTGYAQGLIMDVPNSAFFTSNGSGDFTFYSGGYLVGQFIQGTSNRGQLNIGNIGSPASNVSILMDGPSPCVAHQVPANSGTYTMAIYLNDSGATCGSITIDAAGSTNYGVSSDKRLKENFRDVSCLDLIKQIKIWKFDWKDGRKDELGVVAQEVFEIFPDAVIPGDDHESFDANKRPHIAKNRKEIADIRKRNLEIEKRNEEKIKRNKAKEIENAFTGKKFKQEELEELEQEPAVDPAMTPWQVDKSKLVIPLLRASQEQQAIIESQAQKIQEQEETIQELINEISAIKERLSM